MPAVKFVPAFLIRFRKRIRDTFPLSKALSSGLHEFVSSRGKAAERNRTGVAVRCGKISEKYADWQTDEVCQEDQKD